MSVAALPSGVCYSSRQALLQSGDGLQQGQGQEQEDEGVQCRGIWIVISRASLLVLVFVRRLLVYGQETLCLMT